MISVAATALAPIVGVATAGTVAAPLVRLDGADTSMLHVVDAGAPERMQTGMRVIIRWRLSVTAS